MCQKANFQKLHDGQIEFDRNIDLFLPTQNYQISSDYQFSSFIEPKAESTKEKVDNFLIYINKSGESTYDARILLEYYFFTAKSEDRIYDFVEKNFQDFLFVFFKAICSDNISQLSKDNFPEKLKEYDIKFNDNCIMKEKALFIWLALGFDQSDYKYTIIPENKEIFDLEKVVILHNLCVFFSCKLNFIYISQPGISSPNSFTAGLIYAENTITIALRYDNINKEKTHHLFLIKPQSIDLNDVVLDDGDYPIFDGSETEIFSIESKKIYNINLFRCYLLQNKNNVGKSGIFSDILNAEGSFYTIENLSFEIELKSGKATINNFLFPTFNDKKDATLFNIYYPKSDNLGIEIIDMCFNDTSVFIISKCTYDIGTTFIQIFEGSIGSQYLDDMYLCEEIIYDDKDIEVFGKISLIKSNRVTTPTALILIKKEADYLLFIYKKPKIISMKLDISNNIFYPPTSQYYSHWELIYDKKIINVNKALLNKKFSEKSPGPQLFNSTRKITSIDFDGKNIILKDDNEYTEVNLDRLNTHDGIKECINDQKKWKKMDSKEVDQESSDSLDLSIPKGSDVIGIEINNNFFILLDKENNIYFHAPRHNFYLKSAIKSAFYQYREKIMALLSFFNIEGCEIPVFGIIKASIDVGYSGNIDEVFGSNSLIPGIYYKHDDKEFKEKSKLFQILRKLSIAFSNAGMMVGKDIHRTKCQLVAAYALSTEFVIYGPNSKVTTFIPRGEVYDNWNQEKAEEMIANLVATYSVLLEMKSDLEFQIAMKTLKTTKAIIDDFNEFYDEFKNTLWNIYE